jgi:hypothetical protein
MGSMFPQPIQTSICEGLNFAQLTALAQFVNRVIETINHRLFVQ